jgi:hypothetical protein
MPAQLFRYYSFPAYTVLLGAGVVGHQSFVPNRIFARDHHCLTHPVVLHQARLDLF